MKIIIPTYRRTDRQFTLRCIPKMWHGHTTLVCDAEDSIKLEKYGVALKIVPPKIKTIAQKRAWIIKQWAGEKILMFDDDLRFNRRDYTKRPTFLRQATEEDTLWALAAIERKLEKFAHVGISARQGNNNLEATQRKRNMDAAGTGEMRKLIRWEPNYRMMYALGYDTDVLLKTCKLGRIEHREDMDYCLQLLRAGYENRVLAEFCVDQVYGVGAGGAKLDRTIEASNDDAEKLARLHPGLVKVTEKDYKKSTPRKEVICYWKKAYESSQED